MPSVGSTVSWRSALGFPGILGTLSFGLYVAWNACWLAQGRVPPSLLLGLTGLPAPTTGMTRSTLAFLEGDWSAAFLWNPFTLPFCALLLFTVGEIAWKYVEKRRLVMSKPLAVAWPTLLLVAWITKLTMGSQWW
jgi:hypothetical protein